MHRKMFTFILMISVLCGTGFSDDITVSGSDPADFTSIQTAIEDAGTVNGDVIIVAPGTYIENIDFKGKAITVRSGDIADPTDPNVDPYNTIIDGGGAGSVVDFHMNEGTDSVLKGFTITNGSAYFGGGIECNNASPTIEKCIITGNNAIRDGGGIDCFGSGAVIADCMIFSNTADRDAGGISMYNCSIPSPYIINCLLYENACGEQGGAINIYDSSNVNIANCTIADNAGYGGVYVNDGSDQASIVISNSILWGNSVDLSAPGCTVNFTTIQTSDNPAQVYDEDPGLITGPLGNYYLMQIDGGQIENGGAVDEGDADASTVFVDIANYTTATNGAIDTGLVDRGFHYPPATPDMYSLTTMVVGGIGGIDPDNPAGSDYYEFSEILLTAIPDPNYRVLQWIGTDDDTIAGLTNSVAMDGPKIVEVEYVEKDQYILDVSVVGGVGGTVEVYDVDRSKIVSPGSLYEGRYNLEAVADDGWVVKSWTGVDEIYDPNSISASVELQSDREVTIEFIADNGVSFDCYVIAGEGNIEPRRGNSSALATEEITAMPARGWQVKEWEGTVDDLSTSNTNYVLMDEDHKSIGVEFEINPDRLWLEVVVLDKGDGTHGTVDAVNGSGDTVAGASDWYCVGETVNLTAIADPNYAIVGWTGTDMDEIFDPCSLQIVANTDPNNTLTLRPEGNFVIVEFGKIGAAAGSIWIEDANGVPELDPNDPNLIKTYDTIQDAIGEIARDKKFIDFLIDEGYDPVGDVAIEDFIADLLDAGTLDKNKLTIVVADGVYSGFGNISLDYWGWPITVKSELGPENCIIDAESAGRAATFDDYESYYSVLEGFTIINGSAWNGGGILITDTSEPKIKDCIIYGCTATELGGGIAVINNLSVYPDPNDPDWKYDASKYDPDDPNVSGPLVWPMITGCHIYNNLATRGGGLSVSNSNAIITNTIIGDPRIDQSMVYSDPPTPPSSLEGNMATGVGGGVFCRGNEYTVPKFANCLITSNMSMGAGGAVFLDGSPAYFALTTIAYNYANDENYRGGLIGRDVPEVLKNPSDADSAIKLVTHCILWGNNVNIAGDNLEAEFSGIENYNGDESTVDDFDPWFDTGPLGDFYLTQSYSDYDQDGTADYLFGGTSPYVNAGDGGFSVTGGTFLEDANELYDLGASDLTTCIGNGSDVVGLNFMGSPIDIAGRTDYGFHFKASTAHMRRTIDLFVDDWNWDGQGHGVMEYWAKQEVFPATGQLANAVIGTATYSNPVHLEIAVRITDLDYGLLNLSTIADPGMRVHRWSGTNNDFTFASQNGVFLWSDVFVSVSFEVLSKRTINFPGLTPYTSLQDAIDDARTGDEIVVEEGTYVGTGFDIDYRGITIRSTDPSDPEVVARTIIDCEGQTGSLYSSPVNPMRYWPDPEVMVTGAAFTLKGDEAITLNGLTIVNAQYYVGTLAAPVKRPAGDDGWHGFAGVGGAIYIDGDHIIANCVIENCSVTGGRGYGGTDGKLPSDSNPLDRPAGGFGGDGGDAWGGGIFVDEGSPQILNCTINNCSVIGGEGIGGANGSTEEKAAGIAWGGHAGAAGSARGGGIFINSIGGIPTISNCTISNCSALSGNGALGGNGGRLSQAGAGGFLEESFGGGLYLSGSGQVVIDNCTFANNIAKGGRGGDAGLPGGVASGNFGGGTRYDPLQGDVRGYTSKGGGVYCDQNTYVDFTGSTFVDNESWGSISGIGSGNAYQWEPRRNYQLPSYGGGVYSGQGSNTTFTDCLVSGNKTTFDAVLLMDASLDYFSASQYIGYGGGISGYQTASMEITGSHLAANESPVGGGVYSSEGVVFGGLNTDGVFVPNLPYGFHISDCNVVDNIARLGGGIYVIESYLVDVNDVTVSRNIADPDTFIEPLFDPFDLPPLTIGRGGGMFIYTSEALIKDSVFTENHSSGTGGGILFGGHRESLVWPNAAGVVDVSPELQNCLVTGNTAVEGGGGIVTADSGSSTILNCTIADNVVTQDEGYGGGMLLNYDSDSVVTDSILWNNIASYGSQISVQSSDPTLPHPSEITISYSDIQGYGDPEALSIDIGEGGVLNVGEGVIGADPLFIYGYHLSHTGTMDPLQDANSPAIDAGSDLAENLGLGDLSTRSDSLLDVDAVDLGYHYADISQADEYMLYIDMSSEHGSWVAQVENAAPVSTSPILVSQGATVIITVEPDVGYRVNSWSGTIDDNSGGLTNTVVMGSADEYVAIVLGLPTVTTVSNSEEFQQALSEAKDGDEIQLLPTTYYTNGFIFDKNITITGTNPDDQTIVESTIIESQGESISIFSHAVFFTSNTGPGAVLDGITIANQSWGGVNGYDGELPGQDGGDGASVNGAGIMIAPGASPIIRNCIIRNFHLTGGNGGKGADAVMAQSDDGSTVLVSGGRGGWGGRARGGGVFISDGASPTFINCTISDCSVTGGNGGYGGDALDDFNPSTAGFGGLWSDGVLWQEWGYAGDYTYYSAFGGGVYCDEYSSPKFIECTITGNTTKGGISGRGGETLYDQYRIPFFTYELPSYGGGIYCASGSDVLFKDCTISFNIATQEPDPAEGPVDPVEGEFSSTTDYLGYGGGIAFGGFSEDDEITSVIIEGCSFNENKGSVGGGVYWENAKANIDDSKFVKNAALLGAAISGSEGAAIINNCDIMYNMAGIFSGLSIYDEGAPVDPEDPVDGEIIPNAIGGIAGQGGGIYCSSVSADITNSYIYQNDATASGGGIFFSGTGPEGDSIVKNCLVVSNSAGRDGAGVSANWYSDITIANSTIVDNEVTGLGFETVTEFETIETGFGGGVYTAYYSYADIIDSILTGNTAQFGPQAAVCNGLDDELMGSSMTVNYSAVYDGQNNIFVEDSLTCVLDFNDIGNIILSSDSTPMFVSALTSDPEKTEYHKFYLDQDESPCVDAGSDLANEIGMNKFTTNISMSINSFDFDIVDIGYHYAHPMATAGDGCAACDYGVMNGVIDMDDLAFFVEWWLTPSCDFEGTSTCYGTDLDGSATVDLADFALFTLCWGVEDTTPPVPNPAQWAIDGEPNAVEGVAEFEMEAQVSVDAWWGTSVMYYFECTNDPSLDSGWISEPVYTATNAVLENEYMFVVWTRDIDDGVDNDTKPTGGDDDPNNTTDPSEPIIVWTERNAPYVPGANGAELMYAEWAFDIIVIDPLTGAEDYFFTGLPYVSAAVGADYPTVTMIAEPGVDPEGKNVEYRFQRLDEVTGVWGGQVQSEWSSSTTWTDGQNIYFRLVEGQEYSYRILMRDKSTPPVESLPSTVQVVVATVVPDDGDVTPPPTPQFTWISYPATCLEQDFEDNLCAPLGTHVIMTATAVADPEGFAVQYYFEEYGNAGNNSGWITTPIWTAQIPGPLNQHWFRVRARDTSQRQNVSDWSDAITY